MYSSLSQFLFTFYIQSKFLLLFDVFKRLIEGALKVITALLSSLQGREQSTLAALYMNTGRLSTLNTAIGKLFKFFITVISAPHITHKTTESTLKILKKINGNSCVSVNLSYKMSVRGFQYLVELEKDGSGGGVGGTGTGTGVGVSDKGMRGLFARHSPQLIESILSINISDNKCKNTKSINTSHNVDNSNDNDDDDDNKIDKYNDIVINENESMNNKNKHITRNKNLPKNENNNDNIFDTMEDTDFRLLQYLVSAPWGFLGTPHALNYLINALLINCKKIDFSHNMLEVEEKLLSHADIMISLLVPFSYSLYPPSDNQKIFYPDDLFDSSEKWGEIYQFFEARKFISIVKINENISNLDISSDLNSIKTNEDMNTLEMIKDVYNDSILQLSWPGLHLSISDSNTFSKSITNNNTSEIQKNSNYNEYGYNNNEYKKENNRINFLLNIISGKLMDVLEAFLLPSVWLQSTALQVS